MALDGNALGAAMASAIIAAAKKENASPETIWKAIGNEIVNHIKNNAEVTVDAGIEVQTNGICATSGAPLPRTGQTTATGTGKIS